MKTFQDSLKSCCRDGDGNATIVTISCPPNFNMKSIIVSRESLHRLCGYGETTASRYLDDQVIKNILNFYINFSIIIHKIASYNV